MSDSQRIKRLRSIKEIISNIESNIGPVVSNCICENDFGSTDACRIPCEQAKRLAQLRKQTEELISKAENRLGR